MRRRALIVFAVLMVGCQPKARHTATTRPATQAVDAEPDALRTNPFLPVLQPQKLTIWQLTLPYGSVSGNEPFWKRVDETALDIDTHNMLYKNGLRAGEVAAEDWGQLRDSLNDLHATSQKHVYTGPDAQTTELPMRIDVISQSLFFFDQSSHLAGRTFDRSDNILAISFAPSVVDRSVTHLDVHPLVRAKRTEIEFTKLNNTSEYRYVHPQHLYDISLHADIPRDRFMVLAASPEARASTTLGHAFLTRDDQAEQTETVLLILPAGFEEPKAKP